MWDLSQYMVLDPGDVMNTGTPVGMAFSDHFPYLADGEVIDLEIDHLGAQRRTVLPALQDAAPGFDHPDRNASASGVVSAYGVAGDHA